MKISFFSDAFFPQLNGVVTYVMETAQKLSEHGHEVSVFVPKPPRGTILNLNKFSFKIFYLPSFPVLIYPDFRMAIPLLPKLILDIKKLETEVIHIQAPFSVGTNGLMLGKVLKIPVVATCHSFIADKPFFEDFKLERLSDRLQSPLWSLYTSFHNLTDIVICPTKAVQTELSKYGLTKPSVVIPHGINFESIQKGDRVGIFHYYKKFGLKSTDKIAIYSGRLAADKNVETLIKIWKKVIFQIPNAKLLMIGSGPQEEKLKKLVKRLKLTGQVNFIGLVSRETLIEKGLLRIGQIAVSASKIENPSYSLLEEMAFGLPIVAFRMRGIPEIVNEKNGRLAEPDDTDSFAEKIVELFSDQTQLINLSNGAKKRALDFDLEKNIESLENLYSKLIY